MTKTAKKVHHTTIGVDVGGTKIYAARYTLGGKREAETTVATEGLEGAWHVFKNLEKAIGEVLNDSVLGIGLAWAGFVDVKTGTVKNAPNIPGFVEFPLGQRINESFKLPVVVENDARLFTYAETLSGAARGLPHVFGVILGTGVGSGMVINGEIYRGFDGYAGEIGQTFTGLDENGKAEALLSGPGVEELLMKKGLEGSINPYVEAWQNKRGAGFDILEKWLSRLSHFITNLVLVFNPGAIVFGGGVGIHVLPAFLPELDNRVTKLLRERSFPSSVDFRIAALRNAGALGSSFLVQRSISKTTEIPMLADYHVIDTPNENADTMLAPKAKQS
jgi:glucokinase